MLSSCCGLASSRVTLQHEVWLEGDAPLTLGKVAKLEGEACRYHALEVPQQHPDDSIDLGFVIELLDHCAAPVFRWEFRGSVATIERTALRLTEEPTPIAAPNPGPQSLRTIIAKRLRLNPVNCASAASMAPNSQKVIGPCTHPTVQNGAGETWRKRPCLEVGNRRRRRSMASQLAIQPANQLGPCHGTCFDQTRQPSLG